MIIDLKIRKMYNLNQIKNYKFEFIKNQYTLNWNDSNKFVMEILLEISDNKEQIFDYIQEYYRWIMKSKSFDEFPKGRI